MGVAAVAIFTDFLVWTVGKLETTVSFSCKISVLLQYYWHASPHSYTDIK